MWLSSREWAHLTTIVFSDEWLRNSVNLNWNIQYQRLMETPQKVLCGPLENDPCAQHRGQSWTSYAVKKIAVLYQHEKIIHRIDGLPYRQSQTLTIMLYGIAVPWIEERKKKLITQCIDCYLFLLLSVEKGGRYRIKLFTTYINILVLLEKKAISPIPLVKKNMYSLWKMWSTESHETSYNCHADTTLFTFLYCFLYSHLLVLLILTYNLLFHLKNHLTVLVQWILEQYNFRLI